MKLLWVLCFLLLSPAPGWACRVCRPRVQAAIHGSDYALNLGLLLLPVGLLLLLGLSVFFAPNIQRYVNRQPSAHD